MTCLGKHSLLLETPALSVSGALVWEFLLLQGWAGSSEPPFKTKQKSTQSVPGPLRRKWNRNFEGISRELLNT